jgi:DNA-binding transcriptional LysR family regulator
MELSTLRIFNVVADSGSISKAALELHYVQSNVTARIHRLEQELGAQLFVRSRKGMALTPAGEILRGYARRALQLAEEARSAVASTLGLGGVLRLGSLESTLSVRLPKALAMFHRQYDGVELQVTTGSTDRLVEAVLARQLDGAFVAGVVSHPAIIHASTFIEDVVLVTPPDIADLHSGKNRTLIVFRQGCAYRSLAEQWLRSTGIAPVRMMELGALDGILACVGAGLGITLLPRSAVESHPQIRDVRIHELDDGYATMTIGLIRHRDAPSHAGLDAFLELLNESEVTGRLGA